MTDRISEHSRQQIREKIGELREHQITDAVHQIIEFDKTPADLKAYMDRFVIGQEKGKKVMSTAIAFHYKRLGNALKQAIAENGHDIDAALRNTV
ncbi:MAG: hypothetical protein MN733_23630, partial [Nitrososphaera sp.]|nr:hypothetical protein [Nitrososphaera sp.]